MQNRLVETLVRLNRAGGADAGALGPIYRDALALLGARAAPASASAGALRAELERLLAFPGRRLAVYGSLAPGEVNHRVVAPLGGTWTRGFVRGHLHRAGWGEGLGFPALVWDPAAARVPVQVLASPELPVHWARIDEFEGDDYARILVAVERDGGAPLAAHIYVLRARR